MIGDRFAFEHGRDERLVDDGARGPAGRGVVRGHDADRGVRLGGQQLDLEPPPRTSTTSDQIAVISGVE